MVPTIYMLVPFYNVVDDEHFLSPICKNAQQSSPYWNDATANVTPNGTHQMTTLPYELRSVPAGIS